MSTIEVKVPDIGDFDDVPVIEVLVKPGDAVNAEDSLVTLESDKATMDVPAPQAGVVKDIKVKTGDKVSEGSLILTLEARDAAAAPAPSAKTPAPASTPLTPPEIPPLTKGGMGGGVGEIRVIPAFGQAWVTVARPTRRPSHVSSQTRWHLDG